MECSQLSEASIQHTAATQGSTTAYSKQIEKSLLCMSSMHKINIYIICISKGNE